MLLTGAYRLPKAPKSWEPLTVFRSIRKLQTQDERTFNAVPRAAAHQTDTAKLAPFLEAYVSTKTQTLEGETVQIAPLVSKDHHICAISYAMVPGVARHCARICSSLFLHSQHVLK